MNNLNEIVENLDLPDVLTFKNGEKVKDASEWQKRREEIKDILCRNEYGYFPEKLVPTVTEKDIDTDYNGEKSTFQTLKFKFKNKRGTHTVPVRMIYPNGKEKIPFFVYINFRDAVPDKFLPVDEITDNGFGVATFCCNDVTNDDKNLTNGLAELLERKSDGTGYGKIVLWSYFASRVLDYLMTLSFVDKENVAVCGHSKLGKTALVTGAFDERFKTAISNGSGCSGAAIFRNKGGENISSITTYFQQWFCENFKKHENNEKNLPFDQHFLMSLIAPRKICVGTAEKDTWADTNAQFLNCVASSEVYEKIYGKKGLVCEDRLPVAGDCYNDGNIHFHLRNGTHCHTREDWNAYINYLK